MKEFIEKLIGRLEEKIEIWRKDVTSGVKQDGGYLSLDTSNKSGRIRGLLDAIEIVNQLAEEYNNESIKGDLISRSAVIRELNGIYLDNLYDDKEDILEKAIGIVDNFSAPYQPKGE